MAEPLLELDRVIAGYGEAVVLDGVSLRLGEGESLALLGRNGVGKSTLLMTVMGHTRLRSGRLAWQGQDIGRLAAFKRARLGLGWVAQEREVFPSLTAEENLTVASRPGPWTLEKIYELFPRLAERRDNMGNQLSGGEQQMLAIARTLMTNPKILLLDEPCEGLAPVIIDELVDAIRRMTEQEGLAMILVEQHADLALELTQRVIVLERGAIVHQGSSKDLIDDQATKSRYLGVSLVADGA
ncbi:MAG: ABC transporter ATP-binding protein [Rhodospirillales bacterium]|nr:ABC transporter ATP-binding protein [Rhodospirillales bacterium]